MDQITEAAAVSVSTRNPVRRLYNWVLHWAHTPYGTPALFVLAFVESSFFPVPPDVLLMALALSRREKAWWYAAVCSVGSVLGGVAGWVIGAAFYDTVGHRIIEGLGYQEQFNLVGTYFQENAFLYILTAAFTPIPFKVFTIASGVWHISLVTLIAASVIGRSGRFFLVAGSLHFFGAPVKQFIERYFDLLTFAFLGLLVGGYFLIRLMMG